LQKTIAVPIARLLDAGARSVTTLSTLLVTRHLNSRLRAGRGLFPARRCAQRTFGSECLFLLLFGITWKALQISFSVRPTCLSDPLTPFACGTPSGALWLTCRVHLKVSCDHHGSVKDVICTTALHATFVIVTCAFVRSFSSLLCLSTVRWFRSVFCHMSIECSIPEVAWWQSSWGCCGGKRWCCDQNQEGQAEWKGGGRIKCCTPYQISSHTEAELADIPNEASLRKFRKRGNAFAATPTRQ